MKILFLNGDLLAVRPQVPLLLAGHFVEQGLIHVALYFFSPLSAKGEERAGQRSLVGVSKRRRAFGVNIASSYSPDHR